MKNPLAFLRGIWYNKAVKQKGGHLMSETNRRRIGIIVPALILFGGEILKRLLRILYAAAVSDVLYQSSPLAAVLNWASYAAEIAALAIAAALIASAVSRGCTTTGAAFLGIFLAALLFDGLAAFLTDLWQNNIAGVESYAALNLLSSMIEPAAVAAGTFAAALLFTRTKKTPRTRAVLSVSLVSALYTAARLVITGCDIVSFLRLYRYPTAPEITSMITDALTALLFGVLLWGLAYLAVLILCRFRFDKEKTV